MHVLCQARLARGEPPEACVNLDSLARIAPAGEAPFSAVSRTLLKFRLCEQL